MSTVMALNMFVGESKEIEITLDSSEYDRIVWRMTQDPAGAAIVEKVIEPEEPEGEEEPSNTVAISIDPADTKEVAPGKYYHEARVIYSESEIVLFYGYINLIRSSTIYSEEPI